MIQDKPILHGRDHMQDGPDPIPGLADLGGGHTIEDESTPLTDRTYLDFVGAGVTATDDSGGDRTVVTIPGSTGGRMAAYPGHRLGATENRWYTSQITAQNGSTGAFPANHLCVTPLILSRDVTVDRIASLVVSGASGNARLGIYSDNGNLYPDARLLDSGALSTTAAAMITATVSVALTGGELYWLAHVTNTSAAVWQTVVAAQMPVILGLDSSLTRSAAGVGWDASFTYAALPTPFPGSAAVLAANILCPTVYVRCT